jgi:hypothetical protein
MTEFESNVEADPRTFRKSEKKFGVSIEGGGVSGVFEGFEGFEEGD